MTFSCSPLSDPFPPYLTQTMPIYELVRLSTAAHYLGKKVVHLRRAWDEYQLHFSACRCAPCRHNGVPALQGTSCSCICREGYRGVACEVTERAGERLGVFCLGSWSERAGEGLGVFCLGSWSERAGERLGVFSLGVSVWSCPLAGFFTRDTKHSLHLHSLVDE